MSTASRNGAYIKGGGREPKNLHVPGASSLQDDAVRLLDFDPEGFAGDRPRARPHATIPAPAPPSPGFFLFPLICTAAVYYRAGRRRRRRVLVKPRARAAAEREEER